MNPTNHHRWIVFLAVIFLVVGAFTGNALAGEKERDSCPQKGVECIVVGDEGCCGSDDERVIIKTISNIKTDGAFLGIIPVDLNDDKKEALDYKGEGVLVEDIVEDGPAVGAGVKAGDIIIKMGGDEVLSCKELRKVLADRKPGDDMALVVLRDGDEMKIDVKLGERPENEYSFDTQHFKHEMKKVGFLGVETKTLDDQLAGYFEVEAGALIEKVVEESAAGKAKLKAGDVIIRIGDEEIESSEDLGEEIREYDPGAEVEVEVVRKGKKKTFKVELGETSYPSFGGLGNMGDFYLDSDDFDPEHIKILVKKALNDANIHLEEGKEELKEQMMKLKEEMMKLKEEMKELKKK